MVFYHDDGRRFSWAEQRLIRSLAEETMRDVAVRLPGLPGTLVLRVH